MNSGAPEGQAVPAPHWVYTMYSDLGMLYYGECALYVQLITFKQSIAKNFDGTTVFVSCKT